MKRQWKKVMSGVLVAGFVTAGLLNGAAVHAANLDAAVTETTVSDASIKEMLAFAIAENLRGKRVPGQLLFKSKQLLIRYFMSAGSVFGLRFC